uniref:Zgc:56235 n=1 Tax=Sinocyclocheilus rhinocerous TaxID=307959 RepID=A0A673K143_9TELE
MAGPPAYSDLGKVAKDMFSKGYGFGIVKLDLKTNLKMECQKLYVFNFWAEYESIIHNEASSSEKVHLLLTLASKSTHIFV